MFDSIECAAMWLAPTCATCSTNVLGHGVESDGTIYCCANCAEQAGEHGLTDRKDHDAASLLCDFSMGRVIEAHDVQGRTLALRKPPSSVRRISTRPPVTQVWYAGWSTDAGPATTRPSTRSNDCRAMDTRCSRRRPIRAPADRHGVCSGSPGRARHRAPPRRRSRHRREPLALVGRRRVRRRRAVPSSFRWNAIVDSPTPGAWTRCPPSIPAPSARPKPIDEVADTRSPVAAPTHHPRHDRRRM